jgi:LuxR family maltose regulon positive regulatory protein
MQRLHGGERLSNDTTSEHRERALVQAFQTGNRAHCIELIEQCARPWLKAGEVDSVWRWVGRLSRAEILRSEAIATSYIASLIFQRRFAEARDWLRDAEHGVGEESEVTRARLRTLRLVLAALSESDSNDALLAEVGEGPSDSYLSGALIALQAYALLRKNRFDAARRRALRAREILAEHGDAYGASHAEMLLLLAQRLSGDLLGSAQTCERLYAALDGGARNPAWVNAASALAYLRYEQNRVSEARTLCLELLPLLRVASTPENFSSVYSTLARLELAAGRPSEAQRLLEHLHSAMEDGRHTRLIAQCVYERVRAALAAEDTDLAWRIAAEAGVQTLASAGAWSRPQTYEPTWERLGQTHAMLLMHEGYANACRTVLHTLIRSASHAGCIVRAVGLEALLASCEWRCGDRIQAFAALNRAHARTRSVGFVRSVFDEAPGFASVLRNALAAHQLLQPLPDGYVERWHDLLSGGEDASLAAPIEPLTERELAVMRLVAQGLRNEDISERLQIALSTTKWHMKNIFAKLGVESRTEALVRARRMNIVQG